jgi:hypothetical protein
LEQPIDYCILLMACYGENTALNENQERNRMKLGLGEKIRELRLKEGKTQEALLDGAEHSYTAPLVKFVKTRSGSPADIAKTLPEDWPFWFMPAYSQVAKEIKADPRWEAWVSATQH